MAADAAVRSISLRSAERRSNLRRSTTGGSPSTCFGPMSRGSTAIRPSLTGDHNSGSAVPATSVPDDQEDAERKQQDSHDPRGRQRLLGQAQDPEAIDHDGGAQLPGD